MYKKMMNNQMLGIH